MLQLAYEDLGPLTLPTLSGDLYDTIGGARATCRYLLVLQS